MFSFASIFRPLKNSPGACDYFMSPWLIFTYVLLYIVLSHVTAQTQPSIVYVGDMDRHVVQAWNESTLEFLHEWGGINIISKPTASVVHPTTGHIYILDKGLRQVIELDESGSFVNSWGIIGIGEGQFSNPTDIAMDVTNSYLYISDMSEPVQRVMVFLFDGTFVTQWGSSLGVIAEQWDNPISIAIHHHDSGDIFLYVANDGAKHGPKIQKWDITSFPATFVHHWGAFGTLAGELLQPRALTVGTINSTTVVLVCDYYNHRVTMFDENGAFIADIGASGTGLGQLQHPVGVAIDSNSHIWIAEFGNYRIQEFGSDYAAVQTYGTEGQGDGQFLGLQGIDYNVYHDQLMTSESWNQRVQMFTTAGAFASTFGASQTSDGQLAGPVSVAVNKFGIVHVCERFNHRISQFDSTGTFIRHFGQFGTGDGELKAPNSIAIDLGTNDIYVADTHNHRVVVFDSNGIFLRSIVNGFNQPHGVVIDASTNSLFVVDTLNYRVARFNLHNNTDILPFNNEDLRDLVLIPLSATSDSSNSLWVVDYFGNQLVHFDAQGNTSTPNNVTLGQHALPTSCTFSDAYIYVSETGAHTVRRYSLADPSSSLPITSIGRSPSNLLHPIGVHFTSSCSSQWDIGTWSECSSSCTENGTITRSVTCICDIDGVGEVDSSVCSYEPMPTSEMACTDLSECTYDWSASDWTECDMTCGSGMQSRNVICLRSDGTQVSDIFCPDVSMPAPMQYCVDYSECTYDWTIGPFSVCNVTCGTGSQLRSVVCERSDDSNSIVDDVFCNGTPKPTSSQPCDDYTSCVYLWGTSNWSMCSETCGDGTRSRTTSCHFIDWSGSSHVVSNDQCDGEDEPSSSEACSNYSACSYNWDISNWSVCSTDCGDGIISRTIVCMRSDGGIASDFHCENMLGPKPIESDLCSDVSGCTYTWLVSGWSGCSIDCGLGTQSRVVSCYRSDGTTLEDESPCMTHAGLKPDTVDSCVTLNSCSFEWQLGIWSACSGHCSEGEMVREVNCITISPSSVVVGDGNCTTAKPLTTQDCFDEDSCTYAYQVGEWSSCNVTCGAGYIERPLNCVRSDSMLVDIGLCAGNPVPDTLDTCSELSGCTYAWSTSDWGDCSNTCGYGDRGRIVSCLRADNTVVDESFCSSMGKPSSQESCRGTATCEAFCGVGWVLPTSEDSVCTYCGIGHGPNEERTACLPCPSGTISDGVGLMCSPCEAGSYSLNTTYCDNCTIGEISATGAGSCDQCTIDWTYPAKNQSMCESCIPAGNLTLCQVLDTQGWNMSNVWREANLTIDDVVHSLNDTEDHLLPHCQVAKLAFLCGLFACPCTMPCRSMCEYLFVECGLESADALDTVANITEMPFGCPTFISNSSEACAQLPETDCFGSEYNVFSHGGAGANASSVIYYRNVGCSGPYKQSSSDEDVAFCASTFSDGTTMTHQVRSVYVGPHTDMVLFDGCDAQSSTPILQVLTEEVGECVDIVQWFDTSSSAVFRAIEDPFDIYSASATSSFILSFILASLAMFLII